MPVLLEDAHAAIPVERRMVFFAGRTHLNGKVQPRAVPVARHRAEQGINLGGLTSFRKVQPRQEEVREASLLELAQFGREFEKLG